MILPESDDSWILWPLKRKAPVYSWLGAAARRPQRQTPRDRRSQRNPPEAPSSGGFRTPALIKIACASLGLNGWLRRPGLGPGL